VIEVREIRAEEHALAADVTVEGYRSFYRERLGDYAERLRDLGAGRDTPWFSSRSKTERSSGP
jgi:hypothetical protein